MFRSIEYRLYFNIFLLIVITAITTYLIVEGMYVYCMLSGLILLLAVKNLYATYNKFNENILFLLNALDNGDYSFNFAETKLSVRERELNKMMNRIKEILSKARQATIENEKFQSLIVESVSTGIIILDENNSVLIVNKATTQILGMPVFTHINQLAQINKNYPELFRTLKVGDSKQISVINDREEIQINLQLSEITLKKGTMRIISLNNIGNELEAKEMESWIRLIRVMTHEIMNSIAPITSLTDTLLLSYQSQVKDMQNDTLTENTIEALEIISHTAKGLINFVESYRKFTGVPQPQLSAFSTVQLLNKVLALESFLLESKNINVEIVTEREDIILNADEAQITQVLVNLIKNAAEAIEPEMKGILRLLVSEKNGKVVINVCNNGRTIPEDLLPNIFIPFFTTKESGTGIGLSVSRYIMRLHGGNLKHHTKDGWTVFSMVF